MLSSVSSEALRGLFADRRLRTDTNGHELSTVADPTEMDRSVRILLAFHAARQFAGDQAVEDISVSRQAKLLPHSRYAVGQPADAAKLSGSYARDDHRRGDRQTRAALEIQSSLVVTPRVGVHIIEQRRLHHCQIYAAG